MSTPKLTITKPNSRYLNALILIVYITVICILAFMHQPGHDEIIAWDISCRSPLAILKAMKYEGHFCLWHFSLYPFAHAGLPCTIGLPLVSCIYMALAAWVLLYKSPFNIWTKVLMLLFCGSLYSYPVISRCYAMVPLALWLTAYYYPQRMTKPVLYGLCLGFIINTHLYMEGLALMLLVMWSYEAIREKKLKEVRWGIIITILLGLFALVQIIGNLFLPWTAIGMRKTTPYELSCDFFRCYGGTFGLSLLDSDLPVALVNTVMYLFLALFAGLFVWAVIGPKDSQKLNNSTTQKLKNLKYVVLVVVAFTYQALLANFIYFCNWQRVMLLFYMMFFALWIARAKPFRTTVFAAFIFVCSLGYTVYYMGYNIETDCGPSYEDSRRAVENVVGGKLYLSNSAPMYKISVSFGNDTIAGDRYNDFVHLRKLIQQQKPVEFTVIKSPEFDWSAPAPSASSYQAEVDSISMLGYRCVGTTETAIPESNVVTFKFVRK